MNKFETSAALAQAIREEIACIVADSAVNPDNLHEDGSINWDYVSADVHVDMPDVINRFVDIEQVPMALEIFREMGDIWFESAADDYLECVA